MSSDFLKLLIGSKTRCKVLRLFLFNPHVEFYVRELQSLLGEDLTAIRREIAKLYDHSLLRKVSRGNRLYYQVNANHSFYKPLYDLIIASDGKSGYFVDLLSSKFSLESSSEILDGVIMYGEDDDLWSCSQLRFLFIGTVSEEGVESLISNVKESLNVDVDVMLMSRVEYDEMLLLDSSDLDVVFAGSMVEILRKGIFV